MQKRFDAVTDFSSDDEQPLQPGNEGAYTTETYNLWVYDPAQDVGLNLWLASSDKSFPKFMSTAIVFERGQIWAGRFDGNGNHPNGIGGGNIFATIVEPFRRLDVQMLGLLSNAAEGDVFAQANAGAALAHMDLAVDIVTPPIEQGSQGDRGTEASSGTIPRTAIRYEQLCRVTGRVSVADRRVQIEAFGMRSHRRNSTSIYASGAVGHTWATALFPSGRGFHLLSYQIQPDAEVGFLYGHYFDGTRYHDAEVRKFPFYSGGTEPESYELELVVDGETIAVRCEAIPAIPGEIPNTDVLLTRSPARFTLDGEFGGGVLERSLSRRFRAGALYAR